MSVRACVCARVGMCKRKLVWACVCAFGSTGVVQVAAHTGVRVFVCLQWRKPVEYVTESLRRILAADEHTRETGFQFDVLQVATSWYGYRSKKQPTRGPVPHATPAGTDCFPCTKVVQSRVLGGEKDVDCCGKTWEELLNIIGAERTHTTAGYLVKLERRILTMLRDSFLESARGMATSQIYEKFAIDVVWQRIQQREDVRWYLTRPLLGQQRPSFSDIERRARDNPIPADLERLL
eukprot:GHVU01056881.1.p1 GENE.GHVU01056881.1~~GHVU01056881.1.p1  ORF type:complete len:236 (+),score=20.53 GHVU01056881.1:58-765(+)